MVEEIEKNVRLGTLVPRPTKKLLAFYMRIKS